MDTTDLDVLPPAVRAVLDGLSIRQVAEHLALRVGVTRDAHWRIAIEGDGPDLRRTEITHMQIGNVELERRGTTAMRAP